MRKLFTAGILWLTLFPCLSQNRISSSDTLSGLNQKQWAKSIASLLELDAAPGTKKKHAQQAMMSHLASVYYGLQEANSDCTVTTGIEEKAQQARLLTFIADFACNRARDGEHVMLKKMILSESIPFAPSDLMKMAPVLMRHYSSRNQTDSINLIVSALHKRKGARFSTNAEWSVFLAQLYESTGQHEEALQLLRGAHRRTPSGPYSEQLIDLATARVLLTSKEYERCEKILLRNINKQSSPGEAEAMNQQFYMLLIQAQLDRGRTSEALNTAERYLTMYAERNTPHKTLPYIEMLDTRATLLVRLEDYENAITGLKELLTLYTRYMPETHPVFIRALNNLGGAYLKTQQPHHAYVYFRWAYEMMNTGETYHSMLGVDVVTNLADTYTKKGDNLSAEHHLREAASIRIALP